MVASFTTGKQTRVCKAALYLQNPNLARISLTGLPGGEVLLISDGKTLYRVFPGRK
jgi:outer membrane lipoprotein-sorting protein